MYKRICALVLCFAMIFGCTSVMSAEAADTGMVDLVQELGAKAFLKSVNGYMLPASGNSIAENAVDGDLNTSACAAQEWNWMFELDLGVNDRVIGTIVVTYMEELFFPTDYEILVSSDAQNWTSVFKESDNTKGGRREYNIGAVAARYIRIKDLKAHVGVSQMVIREIEVYEAPAGSVGINLISPTNGAIDVSAEAQIVLSSNASIPAAYLSGITLNNADGVVECRKESYDDKIILTPTERMKPGAYLVKVGRYGSYSFYVCEENLTRNADVRIVSLAEVTGENYPDGEPHPAELAVDGDTSTYATLWNNMPGQECFNHVWYYELDFKRPYENMNYAQINFPSDCIELGSVALIASDDGKNWTPICEFLQKGQSEHRVTFAPVTARYVRIYPRTANFVPFKLAEVNILSLPSGAAPEAEILANGRANGSIAVNFSEGMDLATADGIKLYSGRELVECDYTYGESSKQIIVNPKTGLDYGSEYRICITENVRSVWGISVKEKEQTFVTESAKPLEITTVSSSEYMTDRENAIYPAFVDNMPYASYKENKGYDYYAISADGGKGHYTYRIASGSLPDGLVMDEAGMITGTPVTEGEFTFTVEVCDRAGNKAQKELMMEANPYRGKMIDDARFGAFLQWNTGYYVKTPEDIPAFEETIKKTYNPEDWARQLSEMGIKIFNYSPMVWGSSTLWPSEANTTVKNGFPKRDFAKEMIDACHKYGIKVISYVPPNFMPGPFNYLDPESGMWYEVVLQFTKELIDRGVDGFWYDSGFRTGCDWQGLHDMIRTENPYVCIETNGNVKYDGLISTYPLEDAQCWEGPMFADTTYTGYRSHIRKKLGAEVSELLCGVWAYTEENGEPILTAEQVINSIKSNWDNDMTYFLVWPAAKDGTLVAPEYAEELEEIIDWVKANIEPSNTPKASLEPGEYSGEQTLELSGNGKIYYTTDGSIPDENSTLYTEPIRLEESVRIRAAAFEDGKGKSRIMDNEYVIKQEKAVQKIASGSFSGGLSHPKNLMVGMMFKVGAHPLKVSAVGRFATGNDGAGHLISIMPGNSDGTTPPVLKTEIDMTKEETEEDGFKYREIAPVTLEAFKTYYLLCEEPADTQYLNVRNFDTVAFKGISAVKGVITPPNMTFYMNEDKFTSVYGDISKHQQLLNLKFEELPAEEGVNERNLAYSADFALLDNNGMPRNPSAYTAYAYNAADNNLSTGAAAGEAYAWTLHVDLKKTYSDINKITVTMGENGYATEYQIDYSNDNVNWTNITKVSGNHSGGEKIHSYNPFAARYIRVRSLKPDGPGQEGGQMWIAELGIYQTDAGWASSGTVYTDLVSQQWAEPYIYQVSAHQIMCGTGEQIFEPERVITKAELSKVLTNVFDLPLSEKSYSDVTAEDWYYPYANSIWADGEAFNPEELLTRVKAADMIYKAVKYSGKNLAIKEYTAYASDIEQLSEAQREAVYYLIRCSIMSADENGYFAPEEFMTRAMTAKIAALLEG